MKAIFLLLLFILLTSQSLCQISFIQTSYGAGGDVNAIISLPNNTFLAASENGHIYRSLDNGLTWSMVFSLTSPPINCFAYNPINSYIYAGRGDSGAGGVLRSINNGSSWEAMGGIIADKTVYALIVSNNGYVIAGCRNLDSTTGTILISTNNGVSWQIAQNGYDYWCFSFSKSQSGDIYASTGISYDGTVLKSTDNGLTWNNTGLNTGWMRVGHVVVSQSDSLYYYSNSRFYKKAPEQNWVRMTNVEAGYDIEAGLVVNSMNVLFIAGWNGCYSSTNGGVSWESLLPNQYCSIELDSIGYLWIGNAWGSIYRSTFPTIPPGIPALNTPIAGALYQLLTPTLSWQSVIGSEFYQIQVSSNSEFNNPAIDDTTNTTSYTNNGIILSPDTIYYWRVRGFNLNGYGNWSEVRSFRTYSPNAPDYLTGTSEPGIIHLSWTPPVSPGVSALGYNVYRRIGQNGSFIRVNGEALNAQTYLYDDHISIPNNYSYGVRAIYPPAIESALSNIVSLEATVQISPISATPVGGVYNQDQVVALTCTTSDVNVYYTLDGSIPTEDEAIHYSAPISITTSTTLKAKAFKPLWLPSNTLEETYILLNPPQNVSAVQSQTSVLLTWQAPRTTTRVLIGYNVYRRLGETGSFIHLNSTTADTQYLDSGIISGTYYYYVTAVYSDGVSDPSATVSITTSLIVSTPVFTPPPGTYNTPQFVRIMTVTEQDTIYFTRDGSEPTQNSSIFDGLPLPVLESDTIIARAFKYGWEPSEIVIGDYIIIPTLLDDDNALLHPTSILTIYPNPCQGKSTVKYALKDNAVVLLSIYNIKGQQIRILESGSRKAGIHEVVWDGRDQYNHRVTDGIYFIRLSNGVCNRSAKLMFNSQE